MNGDQNMRTSTDTTEQSVEQVNHYEARNLILQELTERGADINKRRHAWRRFLNDVGNAGPYGVYDLSEVRAWVDNYSAAVTTWISEDEARALVTDGLSTPEERIQAWAEFLDEFLALPEYDADTVRAWCGLDDEGEEPPVERPQIDDAWQIAVGSNRRRIHRIAFIGRLHHRWHAHVSYLHPEVFGEANVAQHVTTLRGFRTPDEAIDAAYEFAIEQDERFGGAS